MLLKIRQIILLVFLLSAPATLAEDMYTRVLFSMKSRVTKMPVGYADIKTYNMADTSLVENTGCGFSMMTGDAEITLKIGKKYLLEMLPYKVTIDYENESFDQEIDESLDKAWVEIDLSYMSKDNYEKTVKVPDVFFERKRSETLKELTVTASRIMFYHKGDTLVYKADAFVLAEGSMLDALFEQLPGVELRQNGEIYCRGRRVDNLLLNGKDLFNGNRELMLENIGAYTVKDIAAYEKMGAASELMGHKVANDMQYVMDVRLKKHYQTGFLMNAEGGYGTHDRYLAKLFGLWYNEYSSVAAYANINNLSDSQKPGRQGGPWSNELTGTGVVSRKNAGLTYTTCGNANAWQLRGDASVTITDNDLMETSSTQTYMPPADMYNYSWRNMRNKNVQVATDHTFTTKSIPRTNLLVSPKFKYNKFDERMSRLSAAFNRDMADEICHDFVEGIYDGNTSEVLNSLINCNKLDELTQGHNWMGSMYAQTNTKVSDNNMLTVMVDGSYRQSHSDRFREYDVRYGAGGQTQPEADHQYFRLYPDKTFEIKPRVEFSKYMPDFMMSSLPVYYELSHYDSESTSDMHRLNQLEIVPEFGVLPSMAQYGSTYDPNSSYYSHTLDNTHRLGAQFYNTLSNKVFGDFLMYADINASIMLADRDYRYRTGDVDTDLHRHNVLYQYSVSLNFNTYESKYFTRFDINLSSTPTKASLAEMVDRPRTDPLNIYLGNRSLKDSYTHRISLNYGTTRGQTTHSVSAGASLLQNAQARSYVMDPATGVRTFSTHNVQGNWSANAGYNYFTAFGQNRNLDISSDTRGTFVRNVDLVGGMRRRRVSTVTVGEEVKFNWKLGSHRLSAFADANWHRYLGKDEGFAEFSAWNMKYGVSGVLNLPYNWGLSTDMVMYTRRGYADPNLNTTDVVWNARVSKSLLKGSVVLALDAYDLLHQISTVSYIVNAQARTETVVNSIPSYLLFHIYYRFNKQPKRK